MFEGTLVKYNRKDYEELARTDEESTPPPTVRHRSRVAVSPTDRRTFQLSPANVVQTDNQEDSRYGILCVRRGASIVIAAIA